ncbi:hypothetical protein F442_18131 [Phytophthora nicotianae P10297]|uniref:Aspartic peptidase DDI1-type domain-containing protein n=1 Tax=Phytophthora nicotianae P10297 TaxID=1317064 RepID=W2YEE9_PHYNI|nr:hypothetical protein F442_18131 [Phytophthora nicotianae P10297]
MSGEGKEALVERGKNYKGARGVASVRTETVDIETGTNEKSSPTERTGSERDGEIKGSTERPKRGRVGTAEATERHDVAQDWETRATERPRRVQNADRGAMERSEAALKPQGKIEEREKTVEEAVCSKRSKGALESTPEDAAGTRINQFSAIIGKVSSGRVEPVARNVEDDEESTKGMDSTEQYDRLFTDIELDMLERGDGPGVQNEREEYDKELEERLIPVDEDKILQRAKRNAKVLEEPTLADMSAVLGIPEEVLERTREVSSGDLGTPEYWLDWYANALETSTEAKRANRDFREVGVSEGTSLPMVNAVASDKDESTGAEVLTRDEEGREFMQNVCVRLEGTAASVSGNPEKGAGTLPFRWRSIIRNRVYELLKREWNEGKRPHQGSQRALENDEAEDGVPLLWDKEDEVWLDEGLLRGYLIEVGGTRNVAFLDRAVSWARRYFEAEARGIRDKLRERARDSPEIVNSGATSLATKGRKKATFQLPTEGGVAAVVEEAPEVYRVKAERAPRRPREPGLREADAGDNGEGDDDVVPQGKRVICSVGGIQALSDGYIDCCPSEMLADTGAIASLVDRRVLRRLGRDSESLRPYSGTLDSVSGHTIRVRGVIDLPVTLGTLEKTLPFVVTDHLFVDAILGTDSLKAFRAVIDLEEQSMTLKETGDVVPLGVARVEETYAATISSSVRLEPGRQALVRSRVRGAVKDKSVVLVEGVPGTDNSLRVARTLCTATDGTVLVEVCNASTEEVEVGTGAYLAAVTITPESAFTAEALKREGTPDNISAVLSASSGNAETRVGKKEAEMTATMKSGNVDDFEVDFQDSSLGTEQRRLFVEMLKDMRDLFVKTSKKPGEDGTSEVQH